jgi:putative thioredoxin
MGTGAAMADSPYIVEVGDDTFEHAVLERSHETPVLVDFWAPWCQPCRMLGPLLEKLAVEGDGRFILAKVNTEEHSYAASQLGVSGIPAVFLVDGGKIVGEFVGFQPETQLRQFLERSLPSEADRIAKRAADFEVQDPVGARRMYEQALLLDEKHGPSLAGLADLTLAAGDVEAARGLVERVERHAPGWERAERVLARLQFAASGGVDSVSEAEKRCAADPNDLDARVRLGAAYAGAERYAEALEIWVGVVETDRTFGGEHARPKMVDVFRVLGNDHELVNKFRPRLASALY